MVESESGKVEIVDFKAKTVANTVNMRKNDFWMVRILQTTVIFDSSSSPQKMLNRLPGGSHQSVGKK